jgi:hypothetical protein
MDLRRYLWPLWVASASCLGGFVGWFAAVVALNLFYSTGPPPSTWIIYGSLLLAPTIGTIIGGLVGSWRGFPRRFTLRALLVVTTAVALGLGLAAMMLRRS